MPDFPTKDVVRATMSEVWWTQLTPTEKQQLIALQWRVEKQVRRVEAKAIARYQRSVERTRRRNLWGRLHSTP